MPGCIEYHEDLCHTNIQRDNVNVKNDRITEWLLNFHKQNKKNWKHYKISAELDKNGTKKCVQCISDHHSLIV